MLQRRVLESPQAKTLITSLTGVSRENAAFVQISGFGLFIVGCEFASLFFGKNIISFILNTFYRVVKINLFSSKF